MSIASKRSIKSAQVQMREIQCDVDGTSVTPVASGFDGLVIASVVDNGVGDYTIIFKKPFNVSNSNLPKCFVQSLTADRIVSMSASAYDRVTILCTDLAGAPADADVSLLIKGCDHRFNQA